MWMNTTFSSFFKTQESKTKSYHNINEEVAPMPVRFVEHSLLKHRLWPGKAALQVLLHCGSLRSGPHYTNMKTGVQLTEEIAKEKKNSVRWT
jgi:hypothetical protein